ncbi:MAG: NAD(P)-dependent oxidoreductase [Candidatus Saccharimonadales bacterium]
MNKILVTDSLFIKDKHVKMLESAGFEVERLDKAAATEAELSEAIKGKAGYILGGLEKVTDQVIQAADQLRAIAFTGTNYEEHIVALESVRERGIKVANTPHANANAVAQWMFATSLAMVRRLFSLGRTGSLNAGVVNEFADLTVGVVGLGHIGSSLADLFSHSGFQVVYHNRSAKQTNYTATDLDTVLSNADIVIFCVNGDTNQGFVDEKMLEKCKEGVIISAVAPGIVDELALLKLLQQKKLRAFLDYSPVNSEFQKLDLDTFYNSNTKTSYNTNAANERISDWATESMINLLQTGDDIRRVI